MKGEEVLEPTKPRSATAQSSRGSRRGAIEVPGGKGRKRGGPESEVDVVVDVSVSVFYHGRSGGPVLLGDFLLWFG
jgi:hypothetical protein